MPKLSVLITFYNQAGYVDEALAGVFAQQTDFDYEVLVGDDGSDDDTIHRLDAWRKKYPDRIRIFVRPRDRAVQYDPMARASANRIALVKEAQGQYLAFLDGDDFYTDMCKFQTQIDILENSANADCVACAHRVDLYWDDGRTLPMNNPAMLEQKFVAERYWAVMYFPSMALIFRNVFKGIFPEEHYVGRYFDDNGITCFFLRFGGIYYLPGVMAYYRQHSNSICASHNRIGIAALNLLNYQLERDLHPNWNGVIAWRHRRDFKTLHDHRHELEQPALSSIRVAAEKSGSGVLLVWLNYRRGGFLKKISVHGSYWRDKARAAVFRVKNRGYFRAGQLEHPLNSPDNAAESAKGGLLDAD